MRLLLLCLLLLIPSLAGCLQNEEGPSVVAAGPDGRQWSSEANITANLSNSGRFFTVDVAPGGSAQIAFSFEGEPNVEGQDAAWILYPGMTSGGVVISMMSHDQHPTIKAILATEGDVSLLQVDLPLVGANEVGPPSPDPLLPMVSSILAWRIEWIFELPEGHHHFVLRAVHASAVIHASVITFRGDGVRVVDENDGSSLAQVKKYPNPDDWNVNVEVLAARRGMVTLDAELEVLYPRNLHILGAPGPGSGLTVGNCGSPWGGFGATHALVHWGHVPGSYPMTATITPLTVGNPAATSVLLQYPDHEPLGERQC